MLSQLYIYLHTQNDVVLIKNSHATWLNLSLPFNSLIQWLKTCLQPLNKKSQNCNRDEERRRTETYNQKEKQEKAERGSKTNGHWWQRQRWHVHGCHGRMQAVPWAGTCWDRASTMFRHRGWPMWSLLERWLVTEKGGHLTLLAAGTATDGAVP